MVLYIAPSSNDANILVMKEMVSGLYNVFTAVIVSLLLVRLESGAGAKVICKYIVLVKRVGRLMIL